MEQQPVHVSIDTETLDLQPTAVVLSIGLVAFTLVGGVVRTYYAELDKGSQTAKGRTVSQSTLDWWKRQSPEARRAFDSEGTDTEVVLKQISEWFKNLPALAGVWGYGADFDNALLQSLFRDYGLPVPWPYKLNRCGRTITSVFPQRRPPNSGTKHNALDDATYQAYTIRDSLMRVETLQRGM